MHGGADSNSKVIDGSHDIVEDSNAGVSDGSDAGSGTTHIISD
jgi:hypothetical protein